MKAKETTKLNAQVKTWLCIGGLCLFILVVGVVIFNFTRSISETKDVVATPPNSIAITFQKTENAEPTDQSKLAPVDYPIGSVGEACGVNNFPRRAGYYELDREIQLSFKNSPFDSNGDWKQLEEDCLTALERQMSPINPYRWMKEDENTESYHAFYRAFEFIVIENPLTFERIFTDPVGDFVRVQEALTRPECQLSQEADPNWKLNETCHADSILNYALLTRFCYNEKINDQFKFLRPSNSNGVTNRVRQVYSEQDNPTPEQDRNMWIQDLEDVWVRKKCESLDLNLDLYSPEHTKLRRLISDLRPDKPDYYESVKSLNEMLIELAARLGDSAAGLTQFYTNSSMETGYKYGPLAGWFTDVFEPTKLFTKYPPSFDRLHQIVPLFAKNVGASNGKLIKFDHNALVQHLCTPPYFYHPWVDKDSVAKPPSCREIINELRQESLHPSMLEAIATFEDVAMRQDVYE